MNIAPTVSVIIPTFRRMDYLRSALQSVLTQTFDSFEVIVVEDGLAKIAEPVVRESRDIRVRYVAQEHAGRSAARNLGLQLARGRYIALLDDDDLYLPAKLATQVAFLEEHTAIDLVGAGAQIIDENGVAKQPWRAWLDQPDLTLPACLYSCPLAPSMVMMRRSAVEKLASGFDSEVEPAEDTDFFIRLLRTGSRLEWLKQILSCYRVHSGNSQGDGAVYSHANLRMLDKLFAQADLPLELLAERKRLYATYHLAGACFSYATGQVDWAQSELEQAVALQPEQIEGVLPGVIGMVADFAGTFRVSNAKVYIDFVFDHLPPTLSCLADQRNECHSAFHMARVFRARKAGERPPLENWLLGVYYAPRWLHNYGVWSILADAILGSAFVSLVHRMAGQAQVARIR